MDQLERELLQEELSLKRRLHSVVALKAARMGINADPSTIIEKEDLEREIRTIQRALDVPVTPTLRERVNATPMPTPKMHGYTSADLAHQYSLLKINRRNFQYLTQSIENYGNFDSAPLHLQNQWQDTRDEIIKRKAVLRSMGQTIDNLQERIKHHV